MAVVNHMPYWAQYLYRQTTNRGRHTLDTLFQVRPWRVEGHGYGGYRLFQDGKKTSVQLRGAHNNLARLVWPAERPSGKKRKHGKTQVEFEDGRNYSGRDGGRKRGTDVHKEVEDFITLPFADFKLKHPQVDPLTNAVLKTIKAYGLSAVAAEVGVFDSISKAGTKIDFACLDKEGNLALVELKTGYTNSNFTEVDEKTLSMQPPFAFVKDTPLMRAQFQLLYGAILMEQCMGLSAKSLWVVHATPDTNEAIMHPVSNALLQCDKMLLSGLRNYRHAEELTQQSAKYTIKDAATVQVEHHKKSKQVVLRIRI